MQDHLSTLSGLNAQLFSSALVPFSNDVGLKGIALNKKKVTSIHHKFKSPVVLSLSLPHKCYHSMFTDKSKQQNKLRGNLDLAPWCEEILRIGEYHLTHMPVSV